MSHFDEDDKREGVLSIRISDGNKQLTVKDLVVLVQLFYLPNEHGQVRLQNKILPSDHWWLLVDYIGRGELTILFCNLKNSMKFKPIWPFPLKKQNLQNPTCLKRPKTSITLALDFQPVYAPDFFIKNLTWRKPEAGLECSISLLTSAIVNRQIIKQFQTFKIYIF